MKGLVIKNTGSWYQVKTDDGQFIECKIKGNFRLKGIRSTNPVAVGDRVQIILNQEGTAFINEIEDRKNYIIRRSSNLSKQSHILAANLDQCMLVVTVNYPETSTIFIDRFLASAEAYRVPVKLVFSTQSVVGGDRHEVDMQVRRCFVLVDNGGDDVFFAVSLLNEVHAIGKECTFDFQRHTVEEIFVRRHHERYHLDRVVFDFPFHACLPDPLVDKLRIAFFGRWDHVIVILCAARVNRFLSDADVALLPFVLQSDFGNICLRIFFHVQHDIRYNGFLL